jgi:hypothetical protein
MRFTKHTIFAGLILTIMSWGCHYSLKDVSIPAYVKTVRLNYIENKASYVNPQLSPQLTEKLRQKINNQTKLTLIQGENADYDISGKVSDYSFSTAGISNNQTSTNRLSVTIHITVLDRKDEKKNIDADVTRTFDFSANLSIQQAETQLNESILRNLTDEIFNRIFSSW